MVNFSKLYVIQIRLKYHQFLKEPRFVFSVWAQIALPLPLCWTFTIVIVCSLNLDLQRYILFLLLVTEFFSPGLTHLGSTSNLKHTNQADEGSC